MLERLFGPKRCKVHGVPLERDRVQVRYGLFSPSKEYQKARSETFPNARSTYLGGCRVGPDREAEVLFCPACRVAESRWHEENPEFNVPSNVLWTVTLARRKHRDSPAKQLLKRSQLATPEKIGQYLWIVYQFGNGESIAYQADTRTYQYPYGTPDSQLYGSETDLIEAINEKLGDQSSLVWATT